MDKSASNRYELLSTDDDCPPMTAPAPIAVEAKKKQNKAVTGNVSSVAKKNQANKKPNSEKENKAAALNKNDTGKKPAGGVGSVPTNRPKQGLNASISNKTRSNGIDAGDGGRSVGFKLQNNEDRGEQRPRRNFREGGYSNAGGNDFSGDQQRTPRQFRERENRGPPRNRAGEVGFRSGKREFDRQSGSDKTGVKAIDKRDGAGAHNWGSAKQDIDDLKSNTDAEAVLTDKEDSGNDQSVEQTAPPEEEETKELTLDEWKAMRQARSKPQFNIRKAGEGEDTTQWKKMVALNKKRDGDSEEELEYDPSMYPQRVGRLQRIVDIQFNFNDGRRGGFGGYGRGRGRGGIRPGNERPRFEGGRGGGGAPGEAADRPNVGRPRNFGENKPTRREQVSLKVDDESQFPTLS